MNISQDNQYNNKFSRNKFLYGSVNVDNTYTRINRDTKRNNLYEKIEDYYNLPEENKKNNIIYDALINWFGEKYFDLKMNQYF